MMRRRNMKTTLHLWLPLESLDLLALVCLQRDGLNAFEIKGPVVEIWNGASKDMAIRKSTSLSLSDG